MWRGSHVSFGEIIYFRTRIKATRCETLRTVPTGGAENAPVFFLSFWPHIIHSAVKLSILMCHSIHFQWIFQMSSQNGSIELYWAENEPVTFLPHFYPILFIVQSNYQFWCATLYTFNEFFKWAPKSAQLSSTELKMSQ